MKHCPELENSSELGEDMKREWMVCVWGGLEEVWRWRRGETMMMDRHVGAPPVSKQQECRADW